MKSVEQAIVKNKRVFVRCDIDIPIKDGRILDTFRLDHLLPTLNFLKSNNAKLILAGHMDRPGGKVVEKLSTKHLLPYFNEKLGEGRFELLENLRFDPRERSSPPNKPVGSEMGKDREQFAGELANLADIYVNEAFANSHRDHASMTEVPKLLPGFAGFRLLKEVEILSKVLKSPNRPLMVLVAGVKIETKLPVIKNFLNVADKILVAGRIGCEKELKGMKGVTTQVDNINRFDIGPKTIKLFSETLASAKTIVWSGPVGKFEEKIYENGTRKIAKVIAGSPAEKIVGGGDTILALDKFGLRNKMSFISTGGGAMLEFLAGNRLPGLEALGYCD